MQQKGFVAFSFVLDPVCECLGQILDHMTWCFCWYLLSATLSFKIVSPGELKSKSSNISERNKKDKTFVLCFLSYYLCHMHIFQLICNPFKKTAANYEDKHFLKSECSYSVVAGHYRNSWGSYGAHAQMYPLINMYEGCDTLQKQFIYCLYHFQISLLSTHHTHSGTLRSSSASLLSTPHTCKPIFFLF